MRSSGLRSSGLRTLGLVLLLALPAAWAFSPSAPQPLSPSAGTQLTRARALSPSAPPPLGLLPPARRFSALRPLRSSAPQEEPQAQAAELAAQPPKKNLLDYSAKILENVLNWIRVKVAAAVVVVSQLLSSFNTAPAAKEPEAVPAEPVTMPSLNSTLTISKAKLTEAKDWINEIRGEEGLRAKAKDMAFEIKGKVTEEAQGLVNRFQGKVEEQSESVKSEVKKETDYLWASATDSFAAFKATALEAAEKAQQAVKEAQETTIKAVEDVQSTALKAVDEVQSSIKTDTTNATKA